VAMAECSSLGLSGLLAELLEEARPANSPAPDLPGAKAEPVGGAAAVLKDEPAPPTSSRSRVPEAEDPEMEAFLAALGEQERRAEMEELPREDSDAPDEADMSLSLALPGLTMDDQLPHKLQPDSARPLSEVATPSGSPGSLQLRAQPVARPWAQAPAGQAAAFVSLASDDNAEFRNYMEDGHKVLDPLWVPSRSAEECWSCFAVYDGHGGRDAVDYCESKMHEILLPEIQANKDVSAVMTSVFQKIDGQLAMLGAWAHGCTATVTLVHKRKTNTVLYVANCGDSRAVLSGDTGIKRVSIDHRPDDPSELRRIEGIGCKVRNGRVAGKLAVSRSLGDHNLKNLGVSGVPDVSACGVASGHALIIASDGLWDVFGDEDASVLLEDCIAKAVKQGGGQQLVTEWLRDNAAQTFVDRAKALGSRDNILVLVVFL